MSQISEVEVYKNLEITLYCYKYLYSQAITDIKIGMILTGKKYY